MSLRKIKKNNFDGLRDEIRADICIPGGILFMWGVVPSISFAISVAFSQKNSILAL
jgi:hypothetical protein